MNRQWITSGSTFEAQIGYSRAVVAGDWVFVSGTTGFDYATMTISDSVVEQAEQFSLETRLASNGTGPLSYVLGAFYFKEDQTALNFFGYPVGTPDGAIGPKSRNAISGYQATLGYPPTGQLTDYERTVLISAYHRAIAGGPMVAQAAATHPMRPLVARGWPVASP